MKPTLAADLYHINVVKLGSFTLKSGVQSPVYIDLRQIVSYPNVLRGVAHAMWDQFSTAKTPEHLCGVPYTALPIATCLSLDHNIPMLLRRKETKEYGTKQKIEGTFKPGQTCLVIEDVITTGGSVLQTAQELQDAGLVVTDILAFLDREQGGKKNITDAGFKLHTACTLSELLQTIKKEVSLNQAELAALEALAV